MIRIGSLFSGVGGFELGIERAIPNAHTIWQVEQDTFCQSILRKHWPNATIYDDVRTVGAHNLQPIDILIGGFPCQDISTAGKQRGIINGTRSGLWWEMHRLVLELRPRIIIMENVANIIRLGGTDVVGSLANIGYDCEWSVISARQFGAPHMRKRWFCVAYPNVSRCKKRNEPIMLEQSGGSRSGDRKIGGVHIRNYWKEETHPPRLCNVDDGIPDRLAKLKALGNAIVPQCSEYIGKLVLQSGLLDDLINQ
jgi:DNA (cytosine-5)-methyltransferase 1